MLKPSRRISTHGSPTLWATWTDETVNEPMRAVCASSHRLVWYRRVLAEFATISKPYITMKMIDGSVWIENLHCCVSAELFYCNRCEAAQTAFIGPLTVSSVHVAHSVGDPWVEVLRDGFNWFYVFKKTQIIESYRFQAFQVSKTQISSSKLQKVYLKSSNV